MDLLEQSANALIFDTKERLVDHSISCGQAAQLIADLSAELCLAHTRITELDQVNHLRANALRNLVRYCLDAKKVIDGLKLDEPTPVCIGALDALQVIGFQGYEDAALAIEGTTND